MKNIHPTAIVHPKLKIGDGVRIGAYSVLDSPNIVFEDGVEIKNHVTIEGNVKVGRETTIYSYASIGLPPQNLTYSGEETEIEIGKECHIREYVSINASCGEGEKLSIGDNCFIMGYCHIAHNCRVGNNVIMANGATLGGHVTVGDGANLGGGCAVHQNCQIGELAMIGGMSGIALDVPPYCMGKGYPFHISGLNRVGLKRHGVSHKLRNLLLKAYRYTFQSGLSWPIARREIMQHLEMNSYLERWVEFCDHTNRGLSPARDKAKIEKQTFPELVEMR